MRLVIVKAIKREALAQVLEPFKEIARSSLSPCSHFVESKNKPGSMGNHANPRIRRLRDNPGKLNKASLVADILGCGCVVLWMAFLGLILQFHTLVENNRLLSCGLSYEMCKQAHVFNQCISNCDARVKVVVSIWGAPTPIGTSLSYFLYTN